MEAFRSPWWLRGPHGQTIWGSLFRWSPRLETRREVVELPDGDFLDLRWVGSGDGPIVIVLHGLAGSIESKYARGLMARIAGRGWRGVLMHFRGCAGEPNRLRRSYHSGETGDVGWLVDELRRREPETPLMAVGYSIGGNVLLKYLGEQGPDSHVAGAVAVSVPFDLAKSCDHIENGASRLYRWNLVSQLKRTVRAKQAHVDLELDLSDGALRSLRTFRDFDGAVTAPLHGFADADEYYTKSSSRRFVRDIQVPTLLLHARDDPFMHPSVVPGAEELGPRVHLELSDRGGHVGFVAGSPWRPRYWLDERIPAYLAGVLEGSGDG